MQPEPKTTFQSLPLRSSQPQNHVQLPQKQSNSIPNTTPAVSNLNASLKITRGKAYCNYFPISVDKLQDIHVFSIQFTPHIPIEKFSLKARILSLLQIQIAKFIPKPVITGFQIYTQSQPKITQKQFQSGQYRISVKLKRSVSLSQTPEKLLPILRQFLRHMLIKKSFNKFCNSSKYFDMKKKVQHYAVNVYSGFHVDFVKGEKLFYLRVDSVRKIVCSQTAFDAIEYYRKLCRGSNEAKRAFVRQEMRGRTVMGNYGKNRFYKIKDVQFRQLEEVRIDDDKPLIEYYEEKYGVSVKTTNQPLIVIEDKKLEKQKKKCYLIPELCFMVGLPEDIDQTKQRNILTAMKLQPQQSRMETLEMIKDLSQAADDWKNLQKIGVTLDAIQMPTVSYKKYPKPILQLGGNFTVQRGLENLFNIAGRPIFQGKKQIYCRILHFTRTVFPQFEEILIKNSKDIGVKVTFQKFDMGQISNKALTQIQIAVNKVCMQKTANFLLFVLPNGLKSHYRKIKKICLVDHNILSQLVFQSTLNHRHNLTIFSKILLQILAKSGSTLWSASTPPIPRSLILISFSTSSFPPMSIISTCCTLSSHLDLGYSQLNFHPLDNNSSLLSILVKSSIKCLEQYRVKNGHLPDEIIFISEGGAFKIGEEEWKGKYVCGIWKEIGEFYEDNEGKEFCMVYLQVQRKDDSKFFLYENVHTKARNAQIGTFFDSKIVKKNQFLLITQATPGVSAVPIRFKILTSDSMLPKDLFQQLLFNQCFNYFNFTGLVQVPAILLYAKKCAKFRAQAPFQQQLSEQLQQLPYYL